MSRIRFSEARQFRRAILLASVNLVAASAHAQTGTEALSGNTPSYEPIPVSTTADPVDADASIVELETVIVTGEKVGRSFARTTSSATVVTGKDLRDYGDDSVYDVLARTANTTATPGGNSSGASFSMRGVSNLGAEGFTNGQSAQPVISIFMDGVAVDTTGQSANLLDSYDVDSVEILRGPQSSTQGRNSLGGAIVIDTREPTDYWDFSSQLRAERFGERRLAAAGGGPLGGGFAFRLVASRETRDGFITNTTLADDAWNQSKDTLLRGKLSWSSPDLPDFSALLTGSFARRDGAGNQNIEEFDSAGGSTHRQATNDVPTDQETQTVPTSLRLKVRLADAFDLTATTGLIESRQAIFSDYDRGANANGSSDVDQHNRNLSQELRFNVSDWNGLTGVFGVYGGRFRQHGETINTDVPLTVAGLSLRYDLEGRIRSQSENLAAFTEFDLSITDHLVATAGLRYDHERNETYSSSGFTRADYVPIPGGPGVDVLPVLQQVVPPNTGNDASNTYHALLPKVGLRYEFTSDTNVFATYSEGYRAGGADVVINTGELNTFRPEFTRTYELGLRAAVLGNFWRTRLNVYRTDWRDQQVQVLAADEQSFNTENAGKSRLYGTELENSFHLATGWTAYASMGYSRTRFLDYVSSNGDFTGNRFTYTPRFTGSVGTRYHSPIGLFASASISHTDRYFLMASNDANSSSDDYELLDVRFGYEREHFSLTLYGRNLLGQDYAYYRFHYSGGPGQEPGTVIGYGEPRVFGVSVEVRL